MRRCTTITNTDTRVEHSPTPWKVARSFGEIIQGADGQPLARMIGDSLVDVDANLIVRAVNSHADLLAALEAARNYLISAYEVLSPDAGLDNVLDPLDAVARRARGEE